MSDAKKHQDYINAAQASVLRIGKANGSKPPAANDERDSEWQEFIIAKAVKDTAEKRYDEARTAVMKHVTNDVLGTFAVHDSAFVVATAKVQRGASRIDEGALTNELVKTFNLTVEQATAMLEKCRKRGANVAVLSAMLRQ